MLLSTVSFTSIYAAPNTRLEASRWIYDNVPPGSSIGVQTWDETLPVPFGTGLTPWDAQFRLVPIELYRDRPASRVVDDLFSSLESVDYVILASNRVERGVSQQPWRYPVQNRYYKLLHEGQLGFNRIASFQVKPGIGAVRFDDRSADESLLNYDHPLVEIYQKSRQIERPTFDQLMAPVVNQPFDPVRHAGDSLMLDQPNDELPAASDNRWSASLTDNSAIALLGWIALLAILQLVGYPVARLALGRFADGGWSFARLITLILGGYVVWIGASLKIFPFSAIACAIALLLVGLSWIFFRRFRSALPSPAIPTIRASEIVFWAVFALFLCFRWINPDSWHPIWGGEKPMEFAHINAILRSAHFPPYDPWFSGGILNYYYYGLYLVAFCIKLTGIPTEIAFNLAQPTMMSLLASASFGVASTLSTRLLRDRRWSIAGGLAGTLLVVLIGNLYAAERILETLPDRFVPSYDNLTWPASRVIPFTINEFPYFTGLYADLHAHVVALPITVLVIALCYSIAAEPRLLLLAFSQSASSRNARALIAVRLGLLAVALGALFPTNAWDVPVYAALTGISIFMATRSFSTFQSRIGVTAGLGAAVAVPAYLLYLPFHQHYVALFGTLERVRTTSDLQPLLVHFGGLMLIATIGIIALRLRQLGENEDRGFGLLLAGVLTLALIAAYLRAFDNNSGSAATLGDTVVIAVLVLFALTMVPTRAPETLRGMLSLTVFGVGSVASIIALFADHRPVGIAFAIATAGAFLWLDERDSASSFLGAMIAAAGLVIAGNEFFYVADDLKTIDWFRMNSVFKFYNQVWVLLALAGAALSSLMLRSAMAGTGRTDEPEHETETVHEAETSVRSAPREANRSLTRWSRAGVVAASIVVIASLAYPVLATRPRLEQRFPNHPSPQTLNAIDWMDYGTLQLTDGRRLRFDDDRKVIDWFNEKIEGAPVIAEASIGPYRCNGSRISIHTGLPAVIGWQRHEQQQRPADGLAQRVDDLHTLYASTDPAEKLSILRTYNVDYVVVGELERVYPEINGANCVPTDPTAGIAIFESMVGTSLEVAFTTGETVIYRVLPPS
jgi:YYY domain-containing protein